jgi:hypothetical protein
MGKLSMEKEFFEKQYGIKMSVGGKEWGNEKTSNPLFLKGAVQGRTLQKMRKICVMETRNTAMISSNREDNLFPFVCFLHL